jgi:hypothetical protein
MMQSVTPFKVNDFEPEENGAIELPLGRVPNVQISSLPDGTKYFVQTNMSKIIFTAGKRHNVCIQGEAVDGSCDLFTRIFHGSVARGYRGNPTVQLNKNISGPGSWIPSVSARIKTETLPELFMEANVLATVLLLPVTEIAHNMSR